MTVTGPGVRIPLSPQTLKPIRVREQGRPELLVELKITLNLPTLGGSGDLAILPSRLTAGQVGLVHLMVVRIYRGEQRSSLI